MATNPVWEICERMAEVQALLHDRRVRQAFGRGRGCEGASRPVRPELLRAMFDVGYFPPNTPPVV